MDFDAGKPARPDLLAGGYEQHALAEGYLHRALVGLDQFVNVLTGGLPCKTI